MALRKLNATHVHVVSILNLTHRPLFFVSWFIEILKNEIVINVYLKVIFDMSTWRHKYNYHITINITAPITGTAGKYESCNISKTFLLFVEKGNYNVINKNSSILLFNLVNIPRKKDLCVKKLTLIILINNNFDIKQFGYFPVVPHLLHCGF